MLTKKNRIYLGIFVGASVSMSQGMDCRHVLSNSIDECGAVGTPAFLSHQERLKYEWWSTLEVRAQEEGRRKRSLSSEHSAAVRRSSEDSFSPERCFSMESIIRMPAEARRIWNSWHEEKFTALQADEKRQRPTSAESTARTENGSLASSLGSIISFPAEAAEATHDEHDIVDIDKQSHETVFLLEGIDDES